jgi:hypothetical protein
MKRPFLVLTILLFSIQLSISQKLAIGTRVGSNLSNIHGYAYNKTRAGIVLGGSVSYKCCSHFGFSFDVLLSSKGARSLQSASSDSVRETWESYSNLLYLEGPLLIHYYFGKEEASFQPRIAAGFSSALKLSATETSSYKKDQPDNNYSFSSSTSATKHYKNADLGIVTGLGFNYSLSDRAYFFFDARYTLGLIDIRKRQSDYSNSLYNRNLSLLTGIAFILKN